MELTGITETREDQNMLKNWGIIETWSERKGIATNPVNCKVIHLGTSEKKLLAVNY